MRQGEITTGTITAANERGFQLHGRAAWFNWSKLAEEPRYYPTPGEQVVVSLFDDGWVRKVSPVKPTTPITVEPASTATMQRVSPPKQDITHTFNRSATVVPPARNQQLDREFRLRCFEQAVETRQWLDDGPQTIEEAYALADKLALWAEGREE